jgi:hypothetical protein
MVIASKGPICRGSLRAKEDTSGLMVAITKENSEEDIERGRAF